MNWKGEGTPNQKGEGGVHLSLAGNGPSSSWNVKDAKLVPI